MDLQEQLRDAILDEFRRQAEAGKLAVSPSASPSAVTLDGEVDIDALAMVVAGAVAGGP